MLAYNAKDNLSYLNKTDNKLIEHFSKKSADDVVGGLLGTARRNADDAGANLATSKSAKEAMQRQAEQIAKQKARAAAKQAAKRGSNMFGSAAGSRGVRDNIANAASSRGFRNQVTGAADDIPLDRLKRMGPDELNKLGPENLRKLDPQTLNSLDPKTLGKLDPKDMKKLDVSTLNKLDPTDLKKLDGKTLKKLDADTLKKMDIDGLKKLDGKTLKRLNLSPDYVKDIQKARRKTFGIIYDNKGKIIGIGLLGGLAAAAELGAFAPGGIFENVPFLGGEDGLLSEGLFGDKGFLPDPLECVKDPVECVKQPFNKMIEFAKKNFMNAVFILVICFILYSIVKSILGL